MKSFCRWDDCRDGLNGTNGQVPDVVAGGRLGLKTVLKRSVSGKSMRMENFEVVWKIWKRLFTGHTC